MTLDRRGLLATGAASLLAMPFVGGRAYADPYAKYRGKTIVVNFPAHPHYDAATKVLPEFTAQTGIKVEVDKLQYLRMHDKQVLEMAKPGNGDYDLISYVVFWKTEYDGRGLLAPMGPMFKDASLALPDYDFDDLITGYVENLGLVGGRKGYLAGPEARLVGVPFGAETSVLGYRKDLFAKHGWTVPETYAELSALLDRVPRDEKDIAPLSSRGQTGHQVVHAWLLHLNPMGGEIFDDAWKPVFDNEAGVRAATFLKRVIDTGPAGGASFGFDEMKNAFLQGRSAMYLDSISVAGEADDPAKSRIAGNVGWALHPKDVRRASQSGGFGLAIPKNAANKETAFLLAQWLTSKPVDKRIAELGGSPSRFSTYADPALQKKYPYYPVFGEALKYAAPDWRPIINPWNELNAPILGVAMGQVVTGQKAPKEALDEIVPRVREVMNRAGYYKT